MIILVTRQPDTVSPKMSFHLSYAALALALSHFLVPTYAQTPTTTTISSSTTTNTTNTATPTASYGFTYPVTSLDSKSDYAIQVNTKDSLNITWTYDGTSEEAPTLYLDCWLSNKTLRLPCTPPSPPLPLPIHPSNKTSPSPKLRPPKRQHRPLPRPRNKPNLHPQRHLPNILHPPLHLLRHLRRLSAHLAPGYTTLHPRR